MTSSSDPIGQITEEVIRAKQELQSAKEHEQTKMNQLLEELMSMGWNDCFTVNFEKVAKRSLGLTPFTLKSRIHNGK